MKRLNLIVVAALAIAGAASCEKQPTDFPIVGNLTLTGESANCNTKSWYPGEQLGVFVTSDGLTQTNLIYAPSETCTDESVDLDGSKYWMYGDPVGNVALNAKTEAAGFKQGVHTIYAYSPYNASATDITAIPMPDLTQQDETIYVGQNSNPALSFIYTSKEVKEYTAAPIDLGKFNSINMGLNTGTIEFKGEGIVGKKIVKIIVNAEKTIAYKNATYNMVEKKINGEPSPIEVKTNLEIVESMAFDMESMTMKAVIGSDGPAKFVVVAPNSVDDFKTLKFSFTAFLDDNSEWIASDVVASVMSLGDEHLVSFGGKIALSKK